MTRVVAPLLVASATLAIVGITVVSSSAQQQYRQYQQYQLVPRAPTTPPPTRRTIERPPTHTLTTINGIQITQWVDGARNVRASVGKTPLRDGQYRLTNGGAISVRGGVIVWDAFGVIDRFKRSGSLIPGNNVG